jgi:SAM-dependent methyltransferase
MGATGAPSGCAAEMHEGSRLRLPLLPDRPAWIEGLVRETAPAPVAHLGCTDSPYTAELLAGGALLHQQLVAAAPGVVTGIDIDAAAVDLLRLTLPDEQFLTLDVTGGLPDAERGHYGLVVAGEVLEHVPDADRFLRGARELLAPGGRLVVTVPNATCPKIGLRALLGRESVHPDHRVYYGPRTLERTLAGAGYRVEFLGTCFAPVASAVGRRVVNPLLAAAHRAFGGPVGDGLVAIASARSNASAIAS